MFIVVSNINKIPKELDGFQVELWSSEEFLERAYSDDGLDLDEGLWYHTIILTKELYDALESYVESGDIKFYRFNTDPAPSFEVNEKVCIDPNAQAPVFESEPGPVEEVKVDITPKIKEEPEEEPGPEEETKSIADSNELKIKLVESFLFVETKKGIEHE